ncbi:MAG: fluoroacetyl-CoA thioesterase [Clostridia bacterium]|jgi:predicted thioesterase|nr:fluoroacetyl-CoA thioesterase [Clostridia bacterium]MDN5321669.1 fluoroacetyl-CoA thioesterase [Clostridia bacterium]
MNFNLSIGLEGEAQELVTQENTAKKYGSGGIEVYATPAMVGLMENACLKAVDPQLPEGFATVGIHLDIKHLAATPIGMNVRAKAILREIDGKKLTFSVQAYDEKEMIGKGNHTRYIIQVDKFLQRSASKAENQVNDD